ncbi:hypothetical protein DNH61_05840 [Paenibacillus sambharensis]|uniref:Putative zinc-finger domain-containing protein n=1 Tax=Paenibacillus sambharensis TaxID=1803190 RepID=A0A2W1L948_9BACL|nr:zf-HC2 domain-containing protein [Paenibacillus sambharensis]PZD96718.1 hypothetical protein DNH61_05840 [Paenibacillus sambharensis]
MSERCERVSVLIPWLVNDTLQASEKREVYGHLTGCPGCRSDLVMFMTMKEQVSGEVDRLEDHKVESLFTSICGVIEGLAPAEGKLLAAAEAVLLAGTARAGSGQTGIEEYLVEWGAVRNEYRKMRQSLSSVLSVLRWYNHAAKSALQNGMRI